ncbi:MAG: hypothetical protein P8Y42_08360 [Exilibacterium sp.]
MTAVSGLVVAAGVDAFAFSSVGSGLVGFAATEPRALGAAFLGFDFSLTAGLAAFFGSAAFFAAFFSAGATAFLDAVFLGDFFSTAFLTARLVPVLAFPARAFSASAYNLAISSASFLASLVSVNLSFAAAKVALASATASLCSLTALLALSSLAIAAAVFLDFALAAAAVCLPRRVASFLFSLPTVFRAVITPFSAVAICFSRAFSS